MHHLSLEDLIEHFNFENINLSRRQVEALINLFEPNTADLVSFEATNREYVVRHLFNKPQREKYYKKKNSYLFADIVLSCML